MLIPSASRKTKPPKLDDFGRRVVLHGIDWNAYKTICGAIVDRPVRMTYADGVLEIMTLSLRHDRYKDFFGLIVFILARHFRIKIMSCGSFTHQRDDIQRGFEPDESFYIANIAAVTEKDEVDLGKDPPPDLAIEVDTSRSWFDRMDIYVAFGVPEVWRFDGKAITIHVLKSGAYEIVESSLSFPKVPVGELVQFLAVGRRDGNVAMAEELEKWLANLAGNTRTRSRGKKR